jgi:hypothetical protein
MIDVAYFRKVNSNYVRSQVNELTRSSLLDNFYILFSNIEAGEIKSNDLDMEIISDDDLIICS